MTLRNVVFWLHLIAGVLAGSVILIMSATGVALTYERQIGEWAMGHLRSVPPAPGASPLPIETLLARVGEARPGLSATAVTISARVDAPVVVQSERRPPLYVDAYTAMPLGDRRGESLRAGLAQMRSWHRWLALAGEGRVWGRAITGWSNLLFAFIVLSGMVLWLPRVWSRAQVRAVLLFRRRYGTSKARDFNWHNVIGIWTAIPLFIVVVSAVPISFPWASDLVYRFVGEQPPRRPGPPGGQVAGPAGPTPAAARGDRRDGAAEAAPAVSLARLDRLWTIAAADLPGWRTVTVRLPRRDAEPVVFTFDRGDGGQPQLRWTLTLDRTGAVVARETFGDQSPGRRLRSLMRFAHTGEVLGVAGQTIAGLVSAGAVVMVWTGLSLTWRRFGAWRARRRDEARQITRGAVSRPAARSSVNRSEESLS